MKRFAAFLLLCILLLTLTGCAKTYDSTDDLMEKVRAESGLADADATEFTYAGTVGKNDRVLIWYISGNEYQMHSYFPVECIVKGEASYEFVHIYNPIKLAEDVYFRSSWQSGMVVCVNNPDCRTIVFENELGTTEVPIDPRALPYVFYQPFLSGTVTARDAEGNDLFFG